MGGNTSKTVKPPVPNVKDVKVKTKEVTWRDGIDGKSLEDIHTYKPDTPPEEPDSKFSSIIDEALFDPTNSENNNSRDPNNPQNPIGTLRARQDSFDAWFDNEPTPTARLASRPILPIESLVNKTQDRSIPAFVGSPRRADTTPLVYPTQRAPSNASGASKVADVSSGDMWAADGALIGAGVFMIVLVSYVGAVF